MKKILLSLAALLLIGVSASAQKTLECDLSTLPTASENTTWDKETNTFSWTASSYNSCEIFGAGDYSAYETLNYTATAGTCDHFRIIFKFSNGASQVTYNPAAVGTNNLTWATMGVSEDNLPFISSIRISGANDFASSAETPGTVNFSQIYLEGPDIPVYNPVKLYAQDWTPINSATNYNVAYPFTFKEGKPFWGSDANSATPNQDVTSYTDINIIVSATGGGKVRAFLWNDETNAREIVYFHKVGDTGAIDINTAGTYTASLGSCTKLLGIKWDWGCNNVVIDAAFLSKSTDKSNAVNEARTFSSSKILDFSTVTDVEAYIATAVDGDAVTLKQVTGAVPANTGLVLIDKTGESIVSIPTCGAATEDVTGNLLVAATTATTVEKAASGTNYVLAGSGSDLGWYSINAVPANLAAGKAYLANVSSEAKVLNMVFDDEDATAIKNVQTATADNVYYTLQGVRVANPQKGIFIQNGKKVLFK